MEPQFVFYLIQIIITYKQIYWHYHLTDTETQIRVQNQLTDIIQYVIRKLPLDVNGILLYSRHNW